MDLRHKLLEVLGASDAHELVGGHQSRVFLMTCAGAQPVIAKVLDGGAIDRPAVETLLQMIAQLAEIDPQVCRPIPIAGELVTGIVADHQPAGLLTCYEYAGGVPVDPAEPADAARMGRALGRLHQSLRLIPDTKLPVVAALRADEPGVGGAYQLLHGDFGGSNLRRVGGRIRIFDLDDCGYGPIEFEIANSLYMVLFDAVTGECPATYRRFAGPFVAAYGGAAGADPDSKAVSHFIGRRISALGRWIDDPSSAPAGIRNASPQWREILRAFVRDWGDPRLYGESL